MIIFFRYDLFNYSHNGNSTITAHDSSGRTLFQTTFDYKGRLMLCGTFFMRGAGKYRVDNFILECAKLMNRFVYFNNVITLMELRRTETERIIEPQVKVPKADEQHLIGSLLT